MSLPNPGATEEQLLEAEDRLGYRIPDQYREFLTIANGWSDWNQSSRLLSCDEIGHGTLSEKEGVGIRLTEGNRFVEWETDEDWVRIVDDPESYWESFILHRASQGCQAGQLMVMPHGDRFYDSFEDYLVDELKGLTVWLDGEELGAHGRYWGRDLRLDPPSMHDIVERLVSLRAEFAEMREEPVPAPPNGGGGTVGHRRARGAPGEDGPSRPPEISRGRRRMAG